MTDFRVPGYDVIEMLGFGASAEVWRGVDLATGQSVALKRLFGADDAAAPAKLRREAGALRAVDHEHVVRLREVRDVGNDVVLVLDYAAGGSLAALLADRGFLAPGEVVTVAVPLAQALAAAAQCGIVHGDISPANILFTADGRPLLSDFGVAHVVGASSGRVHAPPSFLDPVVLAGAAPTPASDVFSLGAVCLTALGATVGDADVDASRELTAVLRAASAADPAQRPGAAQLAAALFDACPPTPVRLRKAAAPPLAAAPEPIGELTHRVLQPVAQGAEASPSRPRRTPPAASSVRSSVRRLHLSFRTVTGIAFAFAATALAVRLGVAWAHSDGREARPAAASATAASRDAAHDGGDATAGPVAASDPWRDVLRTLDARRSAAFAAADPGALDRVYARGSPAMRRDRVLLAALVAKGAAARGLHLDLRSVMTVEHDRGRAVLRVVDVMSPYDLVGDDGRALASRPGRAQRTWLVTLVRASGEWRVYDVVSG